ncbi:hypothetical protein LSAT2_027792 [Lamellibrachia satsuma]|nr:hypothetical protein LSAT2_027792 [Lamellibrachia satsuma]
MEMSAKSSMLALVVSLQFVVVLTERRVITRVDPPPDDCSAVNCSWGDWSSWGPCDQPCGDTGVSSRTRSVTTRDSCGGQPCDGDAEETRECNRGCRNGGTPRHGRCHCTNEFWGKCCESACTPIPHCESITCTNVTDHECRRCKYDRGYGRRAYIPTNRDGHRLRVCAMTTAPSLVHCLVVAERVTGQRAADSVSLHCDNEDDHVVYTNLDVRRVQVDFKSMFAGPSQAFYPLPSYIAAFRVGIVHAKVEYNVTRGSSLLETSSVACSGDSSVDNPHQSLLLCDRVLPVNASLQHGDVIHLAMSTENGGYVKVANYDTEEPRTEPARYYVGRVTTRRVRLVMDTERPTHCTDGADCRRHMLHVGPPVTKTNTLKVSWGRWHDTLSGIRGYQLELSRLQIHSNDSLVYRSSSNDVRIDLPASAHITHLALIQPGIYCVLLTVFDNAGNSQRARRFVIFDNTSSVSVTGDVGRTLTVEGAIKGLSGSWLTSTQNQLNEGESVRLSWKSHFANVFHQTRKILSRIEPHFPPLHPDYDDVTGQPPITRSMEAVSNVDGVVKYEVTYSVKQQNGRHETSPWMVVTNYSGLRDIEWEIRDAEGESVVYGGGRVPVHVHDNPTTCEAPSCYCLPKDGKECYSRDYVIAPNMKQMKVPDGHAGGAYQFVVMATNNAMLETTYTYTFTIDTTPPRAGFVSDSPTSNGDVDFQQSRTVDASWLGFIDRESDILFYRYVFSDRCFNATEFQQMADSSMTTHTTATSASHVVNSPGTSRCIVVAYNGALEPSAPVCSDGVTVDVTPPEISAVSIKNAWIRDGLVKDNAAVVWYVDRNRNRCLVSTVPDDCRHRIPAGSTIALYPQRRNCDVARNVVDKLCRTSVYPGNITVIAIRDNLELSWRGADEESGVYNYEVALSSDGSTPDMYPFTTTHAQQRFVISHSALDEGRTFYVHIKAINRAGIDAVSVIGPNVVQTTQSVSSKPITLILGESYGESYLRADWKAPYSKVNEQNYIYRISYGLGHFSGTDDVKEFTPLDDTESVQDICTASQTAPLCVAIPVRNLSFHLHDNHTYFFTLKTEDFRSVETAVVSQPYRHQVHGKSTQVHKRTIRSAGAASDLSPPVAGYVYDVISGIPGVDIDYSTNLNELSASWSAFADPESPVVTYTLSVGKCPTCEDVLSQQNNGHMTSIHLTSLSLIPGQRYFTSVTACNQVPLCTTAVSDGVIVDNTPPVAGNLLDSITGDDIDFQSSRTTLAAHWVNFYDLESGLSHMEWRAGTKPGHDDILATTQLVVTSKAIATLTQPLPLDTTIYVTLKVFNKAGLWVERTSDGFKVDDSAPVESKQVQLDGRCGSFNNNSQVWKKSLGIEWNMTDEESGVTEHYLSIMTEQSSHNDIPTVKLYGDQTSYTFTGLSLVDGDTYRATVTACNLAGLCANSTSRPIVIDNSPPAVGAFADLGNDTDLSNASTTMTYENGAPLTLNIAWSGFFDPHSSIEKYFVLAGTIYGASDLLHSPSLPVEVTSKSVDPQSVTLSVVAPIYPGQLIHLTVWAENKVGLPSARFHSTFKAVAVSPTSGTLHQVNACQSPTCASQCTCTSDGQMLCRSTAACRDVTGLSGYVAVDVYDVVNYHVVGGDNKEDADYTRTQHALTATWRTRQANGDMPIKYEWTVGEDGEAMGEGLLDANSEPVWREAGSQHFAIYTTGSSRLTGVTLVQQTLYVFYVRAWYNNATYAIYRSDGVRVDATPPEVSRSVRVKEVTGGNSDVDFIESGSSLTVSWEGVFNDVQSAGTLEYVVRLGTTSGSGDVATEKVDGSLTQHTFSGLILREGETFFSSVTAVNGAGLVAAAYSDGVKVDTSPPTSGIVWDGVGASDVEFSSDDQSVSASWRGFTDDQSYVSHYVWCAGRSPKADDVMSCRHVGQRTRVSGKLDKTVTSGIADWLGFVRDGMGGTVVFSTVYAVNGAGVESTHVVSNGVTIDTTPPQKSGLILVQLNSEGTSLEVSWNGSVVDPESPVMNFKWAVGTTAGGVQLQPFLSVGSRTEAVADGLTLDDVTSVYVTVVAENAAGHKTAILSQPLVIAHTPPRVCCVIDGAGPEDSDFQSTTNLTVRWSVTDPELTSCEWAIGRTVGGADIRPFTTTSSFSGATVDLGSSLTDGDTLFSTVRCSNGAGLQATASSDGVTILTDAPNISKAILNIVVQSPSYYDSRDNHQADTSRLNFRWDGITDQSGIACFQVSVNDSNSRTVVPWRNIPSLDETFAELRGLNLRSYETYRLQLRAISNVGLISDVITSDVTIETDAPIVGRKYINEAVEIILPTRGATHHITAATT